MAQRLKEISSDRSYRQTLTALESAIDANESVAELDRRQTEFQSLFSDRPIPDDILARLKAHRFRKRFEFAGMMVLYGLGFVVFIVFAFYFLNAYLKGQRLN